MASSEIQAVLFAFGVIILAIILIVITVGLAFYIISKLTKQMCSKCYDDGCICLIGDDGEPIARQCPVCGKDGE